MIAKDWRLSILAIYAVVLFGLFLDLGAVDEPRWIVFSLMYLVFGIAPFLLLCLSRGWVMLKGMTALVLAVGGLAILAYGMYGGALDALRPRLFAIVPALQWVGAMLVIVVLLVRRRT